MKRKYQVYGIIFLATVATVSLLAIQVNWIGDYYTVEELRFRKKISNLLDDAIDEVASDNLEMGTKIAHFLMSHDSLYNGPLCKKELQEIENDIIERVTLALYKVGIHDPFYLSFIKINHAPYRRQVIWTSQDTPVTESQMEFYRKHSDYFYMESPQEYLDYQRDLGIKAIFLGIRFDNGFYNRVLERETDKFILVPFLFVAILISCLAYTIVIINKQEQLDEIKNSFINNLTHELKTPIFSISLVTKVFRKSIADSKNEKQFKYLDLIEKENNHLKDHVEKVLQITQMAHGKKIELESTHFEIVELIDETLEPFRLIAQENKGKLEFHSSEELIFVHSDKTHIKNIIHNLVDNALKYSENEPEIDVQVEKEGLFYHITVKDHGIGMTSRQQQHVFDMFYRVPTGDLHRVKGFGLGLSYVKLAVEAHKGEIKLKSAPNKGTTVEIKLPIQTV
ncbi:sensor histidine kinase [Sediminitomix flava]|uniref:histidine kinase n=1 Tax=Sediminitomix flava TaxID=379075 RepID=A0A315ZA39_SEDFL|nr:HAMP domain-containing sensor histidine kinase [Sediminitomix flava]PWJ42039.1 two-component system phosphate regulon sensor histidine kinase PhoR [Sediminitomix flava]